jgi:acyl carrier protein
MSDINRTIIREIRSVAKAVGDDYSLTDDTMLLEEGLLTSLELLQLVIGLEKALSVNIPLESLAAANFASVATISALVEEAQNIE